jgi:hypothetical protein
MDKLSSFVNEQIKSGTDPTELKAHLARNGWNDKDINTAISNATGRSTRRKIAFVMIGIIIVAALAYGLISIIKNTQPEPIIGNYNTPNTNTQNQDLLTNTPSVQGCSTEDDSIAKDSCYKTMLKNGFLCSTLTNNIELTSCNRANEELMLKGIETIEEN